jgi:hypothetical protein
VAADAESVFDFTETMAKGSNVLGPVKALYEALDKVLENVMVSVHTAFGYTFS